MPTQRLLPPGGTWEYHVLRIGTNSLFESTVDLQHMQDTLGQLGADGWELVNTIDINWGNGRTSALIFVFKRPARQQG
jgi:hypothetical protein